MESTHNKAPGEPWTRPKKQDSDANVSGRDAVKTFQKDGWQVRGQVGSHVVLIKPGFNVNLSVPQHRELAFGENGV